MQDIRNMTEDELKKEAKKMKSLPIFEFLLILIFMFNSLLLAFFPKMLTNGGGEAYSLFNDLFPQWIWTTIFFIVGLVVSVALVKNNIFLRRSGIVLSSLILIVFVLNFATDYPNFSTVIYGSLVVVSVAALFDVGNSQL